mmetsp:Transcript_14058/g.34737  ORF Transcript_14058/g.34737 Transcript_14058/m.34737 type:complete len:182 (-) Transcript_14058:892-1437(-)
MALFLITTELLTGFMQSIAGAFDLALELDTSIVDRMKAISPNFEVTEARKRMAILPSPCEKIMTPGLWVPLVVANRNVYILPGIPSLFKQMVEHAEDRFGSLDAAFAREVLTTDLYEGDIADGLRSISEANDDISIGSYPKTVKSEDYNVKITLEGRNASRVAEVSHEVSSLLEALSAERS